MHTVVNHIHFRDAIPATLFADAQRDLAGPMAAIEGFGGFSVVQVSDTEAVLLISGADAAVCDRIATEVGSPWMRAHVVPLLSGPPDRKLGPVVCSVRA